MRPEPLTRKQKKVLDTFERFSTERGYRPSVAELASELKLAKSTVHFHLMALARKGYLQHREHGRGVRMLEAPLGESARVRCSGRSRRASPSTPSRSAARRSPSPARWRAGRRTRSASAGRA